MWTGSCPCQPFSQAGARAGTDDERHLWPHFRWLIDQCRPLTIFGEQVASKDGREWFSGVRADLDLLGYATGAADLCAAGEGAPHIRQRIFWVGHASSAGTWWNAGTVPGAKAKSAGEGRTDRRQRDCTIDAGTDGGLGYAEGKRRQRRPDDKDPGRRERSPGPTGENERLSDSESGGCRERRPASECGAIGYVDGGEQGHRRVPNPDLPSEHRRPSSGEQSIHHENVERGNPWANAEWVGSIDGKTRRIEPGLEPLVARLSPYMVPDGDPSLSWSKNTGEGRIMRLRGYGNAIVPQVAARFIEAFMHD
ncbi:MAG: DNA cytosine methyltransferase [Bacteroidota bacterium]